jgi:hypothetical protein
MILLAAMTGLLENPAPVWGVGLVLAIGAALVFFSRRSLAALLTLAGIVLATLGLVTLEHFVITPAEEVEQATYQLAEAMQANDLPAILALLAPSASKPRADAETLSKRIKIIKAQVGGRLRVELDPSTQPIEATSRFHGLVDGVDSNSGIKIVFYDKIELHWIQQNGSWLLFDYTVMHKGKPYDAVGHLRGE